MNSINFDIAGHCVSLMVHDDGHDGPAFSVVAMKSRSIAIPFARFERFEDADAYRNKFSVYYPFIKFYVTQTLL